jgi:hypothetical protein
MTMWANKSWRRTAANLVRAEPLRNSNAPALTLHLHSRRRSLISIVRRQREPRRGGVSKGA